eukprot:771187_1
MADLSDLNSERRLLEFTGCATSQFAWIPSSVVDELSIKRVGFIDVTDYNGETERIQQAAFTRHPFPANSSQQTEVRRMFPLISTKLIGETMNGMANFQNRYFNSEFGVAASVWIYDRISSIIANSSRKDAKVELFEHSQWKQPSVIATLPGELSELVILGGHIDSIAPGMPSGRAPGCDDDASGFATALEVFRVLLAADFRPKRTVQLIGYAAEEVGLRGSQIIASTYVAENRDVAAVWQAEMDGYVG